MEQRSCIGDPRFPMGDYDDRLPGCSVIPRIRTPSASHTYTSSPTSSDSPDRNWRDFQAREMHSCLQVPSTSRSRSSSPRTRTRALVSGTGRGGGGRIAPCSLIGATVTSATVDEQLYNLSQKMMLESWHPRCQLEPDERVYPSLSLSLSFCPLSDREDPTDPCTRISCRLSKHENNDRDVIAEQAEGTCPRTNLQSSSVSENLQLISSPNTPTPTHPPTRTQTRT